MLALLFENPADPVCLFNRVMHCKKNAISLGFLRDDLKASFTNPSIDLRQTKQNAAIFKLVIISSLKYKADSYQLLFVFSMLYEM